MYASLINHHISNVVIITVITVMSIMLFQGMYNSHNVVWRAFWFLLVTKAQVLQTPVFPCLRNQRKHYRLKKERCDLSTDTWEAVELRSGTLGIKRGRAAQRSPIKAFSPLRILEPFATWRCFLLQILDLRGKLAQSWSVGQEFAVHSRSSLGRHPDEPAERKKPAGQGLAERLLDATKGPTWPSHRAACVSGSILHQLVTHSGCQAASTVEKERQGKDHITFQAVPIYHHRYSQQTQARCPSNGQRISALEIMKSWHQKQA